MTSYARGPRVRQGPLLRAIKRRALWAARMEGIRASLLRGVRWVFRERLRALGSEPQELQGLCSWHGSPGSGLVARLEIVVDGEEVDTALHELAHACLGPVLGTCDAAGTDLDDHPKAGLWATLYARLRDRYRGHGGPPAPPLL